MSTGLSIRSLFGALVSSFGFSTAACSDPSPEILALWLRIAGIIRTNKLPSRRGFSIWPWVPNWRFRQFWTGFLEVLTHCETILSLRADDQARYQGFSYGAFNGA